MTDVYWNRHRRCWSLRERGRVVGYAEEVHMHEVSLVVSLPAVLRVRRTGQREVCAVARGTLGYVPRDGLAQILYFNPDANDAFVTRDGNVIRRCKALYLSPNCFTLAWGVRWF